MNKEKYLNMNFKSLYYINNQNDYIAINTECSSETLLKSNKPSENSLNSSSIDTYKSKY